jgi:Arc/MetJ-type ribon-helix-helix transcriptional regulator
MMKTLTVKIPDTLSAELDHATRQLRKSQSELVRTAIGEYLRSTRGRKSASFFDLTKDLAGSVRGPGDLSTNKKYLADFGK